MKVEAEGLANDDVKAFLRELQRVYREYFKRREHKTTNDLIILNNLAGSIRKLRWMLQEGGVKR
ncbi:MAG: hypothetical protein ACTSWP_04225 [Candidatus Freyarchaeota archaeon]|nr:hypothetical protein [Candidatus Freyrarchaeum guaymaensis]HDO80281.1 hypothetical protein [Candidatus Bathyarchaeota archaeon]